MKDKSKKEKTAVFRFGVISPLVGVKQTQRGDKERLIREITSRQWEIPYSGRSFIGRSTVLEWLARYKESGGKLESLYPKERFDKGNSRAVDEDSERVLVQLKKQNRGASLPVILEKAKGKKALPTDFKASNQSIYRIFKRHALDKDDTPKEDMRRYEAELPNDLWQSDCMHGPRVVVEGKLKKSFLFAFIDDHSRIIPYGEFYLKENLNSYIACLKKALIKRGLPRKLYLDNGPSFRSHHLQYTTASLGISLIHSTAYRPEGRGKIERWFKTIRTGFLCDLPQDITIDLLNERLWQWIDKEYHRRVHSITKEKPLDRYLSHLHLIRSAPKDLNDYFRKRIVRKIHKDRTVSLFGRIYEGPVELIGNNVTLMYNEDDPLRVEVFYKEHSYGFLIPLDRHINSRIKRKQKTLEIVPEDPADTQQTQQSYKGGTLFDGRKDDE